MVDGKKLFIVGGTYLEKCIEPDECELYGSGLRAACALSEKEFNITYLSCVGTDDLMTAQSKCDIYNINCELKCIDETVLFEYYHPLSKPVPYSRIFDNPLINLPHLKASKILFYGLIEATIQVEADYIVYDPQNGKSFSETNSKAQHLALVLNRHEALSLAGTDNFTDPMIVGKILLEKENAEVVIIKDGANGGVVVTPTEVTKFPVYATTAVWPIGSGDIFSAAFAWKWMMEGNAPIEAAFFASQSAAEFCETRRLPLTARPRIREAIPERKNQKKIYLAAPFFTISERWLVSEIFNALVSFGNNVFSPYHELGIIKDVNSLQAQKEIATKDLEALDDADAVLAVINGLDAGTIMEIGYAVAKGKKVIVLAENINPNDLTMIIGSGCNIESDLSSAIYKISW